MGIVMVYKPTYNWGAPSCGQLIAIGGYTTWFTGEYDNRVSWETYQPTSIMRWDKGMLIMAQLFFWC